MSELTVGRTWIEQSRIHEWERIFDGTQLPHLADIVANAPYLVGFLAKCQPLVITNMPYSAGVGVTPHGELRCALNVPKLKGMLPVGVYDPIEGWRARLQAILTHEMYHLVCGHLERGFACEDAHRWNVAADMAINPTIGHIREAIGEPYFPRSMTWESGLTVEEYDELLARRRLTMNTQLPGLGDTQWANPDIPVQTTALKIPRHRRQHRWSRPQRQQISQELFWLYGPHVKDRMTLARGVFPPMTPRHVIPEYYVLPPQQPKPAKGEGKGEGKAQATGGATSPPPPPPPPPPGGKTADDHSMWYGEGLELPDDPKPDLDDGESESGGTPMDMPEVPSPERIAQIADEIAQIAHDTCEAKRQDRNDPWWGSTPGEVEQRIEKIQSRWKVNWRSLIQGHHRNQSRTFSPRWTWARKDKRFGTRPGAVLRSHGKVFVGVDTSGSMADKDILGQIQAEIRKLARHTSVIVAECDTEIKQVYPFKGTFPPMRGFGGTDFNPFFTWVKTHGGPSQWDRMLLFTDGYGPLDDSWKKWPVPVVWLITPNGSASATFPVGKVTAITP